jgi:hypothetical protein
VSTSCGRSFATSEQEMDTVMSVTGPPFLRPVGSAYSAKMLLASSGSETKIWPSSWS